MDDNDLVAAAARGIVYEPGPGWNPRDNNDDAIQRLIGERHAEIVLP
jgi:hypothetical protein